MLVTLFIIESYQIQKLQLLLYQYLSKACGRHSAFFELFRIVTLSAQAILKEKFKAAKSVNVLSRNRWHIQNG